MAQTDGHVPELTPDPRKCFLRKSRSKPISSLAQPAASSQRVYPAQGQGSSQAKLLRATACLTFSWEVELSSPPDKLLSIASHYFYLVTAFQGYLGRSRLICVEPSETLQQQQITTIKCEFVPRRMWPLLA